MILDMELLKIKISRADKLMLELNKGKLLWLKHTNKLIVLRDYSIEEVLEDIMERQGLFKKKILVSKPVIYLTGIEIIGYHNTGKFIGTLCAFACKEILNYDLYKLRENWIEISNMINLFGFKIVKDDVDTIVE